MQEFLITQGGFLGDEKYMTVIFRAWQINKINNTNKINIGLITD